MDAGSKKTYSFKPDWAVPVAEVLGEILVELDLSFSDVATTLGIPLEEFRDAVYGRTRLTPELASGLETVTNVPARFWLQLDEIFHKKRGSD